MICYADHFLQDLVGIKALAPGRHGTVEGNFKNAEAEMLGIKLLEVFCQCIGVEAAQSAIQIRLRIFQKNKQNQDAQSAGKANDQQGAVQKLNGGGQDPDQHPKNNGKDFAEALVKANKNIAIATKR